jgi:hypothetical protein
MEWMHQIPPDT